MCLGESSTSNNREMIIEAAHCYFSREGDALSSSYRREAVKERTRTVTKVWTLPLGKKTIISVNEQWFRKYVTDAPDSTHDCYVVHILDDGHVSLLRVPIQLYEGYGVKK